MSDVPHAVTQTSGQAIVDALIRNGVDRIFGIPGIHTYLLMDALHERREEIQFIGTRHEQAAGYMAYGYAKATGRVGAYTCVPGPGVLNSGAALCTAYAANVPVICVTSEIPSAEIGRGHGILHELPDQLAVLRLLTKWAGRINHPSEAPGVLSEAFRQMLGGRQGPVAIECPWDVLGVVAPVVALAPAVPAEPPRASPALLEKAAALIAAAERPVIFVGSGALGAREEVRALSKLLQAPVIAHRGGRGIVGNDEPAGLDPAAGYEYWKGADLAIAVGTRMELPYIRWQHRPAGLKTVRIDIDPREIPRRPCDVGLVADAAQALAALNAALESRTAGRASREAQWRALAQATRQRYSAAVQPQVGYLDAIRAALPREGILVEEICQPGFTARFAYPVFEPRTYVSCGYQDNLGFGYMTALGVKAAKPDTPVVSINGDGGFLFGVQELATAAQHGLGVIAVVFNNQCFGNVRRDQKMAFGGRYIGSELVNPDFRALAQAFGIDAHRVESPAQLATLLPSLVAANAPALIEVQVAPDSEASPWPFYHPWAKY